MEKKIKVFLDSNVLVSIAYTGKGKSRSFLIYEIQALGALKVYLSNLVCEEALSNIRSKRPDAEELLMELIAGSKVLEDIATHLSNPVLGKLPQNDQIILSTAVYHKMDVFVTGNENHFKHLYRKKILNTLILKPVDFLNMEF